MKIPLILSLYISLLMCLNRNQVFLCVTLNEINGFIYVFKSSSNAISEAFPAPKYFQSF